MKTKIKKLFVLSLTDNLDGKSVRVTTACYKRELGGLATAQVAEGILSGALVSSILREYKNITAELKNNTLNGEVFSTSKDEHGAATCNISITDEHDVEERLSVTKSLYDIVADSKSKELNVENVRLIINEIKTKKISFRLKKENDIETNETVTMSM